MTSFKEQEPEKVAEFLDILDNLKNLPIVYIDETGIDRYLYRPYAGAPRGEKVYEKISGRRFERTSIVTGQVDGEFIAPMIYKKSMTSDFFVEWFKTQLLPALKTPHVIVMGNASFHPKNILDELCIQDKHFFLPLPPYSPDLNPIEQAWAILKKKVTDLLREVPTIFECLECFFKTR
ncbi:degenerate transposase [Streptococcus pneumoniae]|nr:degenerate transposase [Streptococcus pneumoniae]